MLRVLSTPALFALELTPLCNNRCLGCFDVFADDRRTRSPQLQRPTLSFEQWRTILDELAPHAHRVKLTGGEPTLYPDFEPLVGHIRELGTSFTVFTNGRWKSPESVLRTLIAAPNLSGLLVSLHGAQAASHEAFAGVSGCFDETLSNIRRATEAGLSVTLSAVLHRANLDELPDMVALARSLGADHVVFNRYLGPPIPEIAITDAQLKQAVHTVDALREHGGPVSFGVCIPQCFTRSSAKGCTAGVAFCTVDPWGNLRPCNHSPLIAGNLLDETLEQAWHAPEMEQFRQAIPDACHTCAAFSTCHGGCRALAMELDLPTDPLMSGPLDDFDPPPPVQMGRNWRPQRRFEVRQEPFGLVLMRGNALLAVRPEAAAVIDHLDGTRTLGELERELSPAALSLIGELFRRNMIDIGKLPPSSRES
jgi:radical SAM protein with 4Fe4S-binding SPASM domain